MIHSLNEVFFMQVGPIDILKHEGSGDSFDRETVHVMTLVIGLVRDKIGNVHWIDNKERIDKYSYDEQRYGNPQIFLLFLQLVEPPLIYFVGFSICIALKLFIFCLIVGPCKLILVEWSQLFIGSKLQLVVKPESWGEVASADVK